MGIETRFQTGVETVVEMVVETVVETVVEMVARMVVEMGFQTRRSLIGLTNAQTIKLEVKLGAMNLGRSIALEFGAPTVGILTEIAGTILLRWDRTGVGARCRNGGTRRPRGGAGKVWMNWGHGSWHSLEGSAKARNKEICSEFWHHKSESERSPLQRPRR